MNYHLHPQLEKDCFKVGRLPLCQVLMMNDRQYPWFILVPQRADVREVFELSKQEQQMLWHEVAWLGEHLMTTYQGEKLNIGALGNMVPQLHVHVIVRDQYDAAWPAPVWGKSPAKAFRVEDAAQRIARVETLLTKYVPPTFGNVDSEA